MFFKFEDKSNHSLGDYNLAVRLSVLSCVRLCICTFMDVGDATSTMSMDVVKVCPENPVSLELGKILNWKTRYFFENLI